MAIGLGLITTSCSSSGPGAEEVVVVGEDPRIIVHDLSLAMEAALTLELEYLREEGCLVVHSRDEETQEITATAAPVWPEDVSPVQEEGEGGITVASVGSIVNGDVFSAVGGSWEATGEAQDIDLPQACLPADGFFLLNEGSIATGTG